MISTTTQRSYDSKQPLIVIIGATGTGKSQLAVELAKRHNGEIINGDAMQLYAGLPIITNKISKAEQQNIPHHLLGCIGLEEPTWVVSTFVRRALQVIEEIRARGKLPILVGGTHYYTQSLLFHESLTEHADITAEPDIGHAPEERWPILAEPTEVLLAELKKVDPDMAQTWHPNDRRKIQRSLMIYLQSGTRASEIYAAQQESKAASGNVDQSPTLLRFPTLLFWVHTETETLRARLDKRVDRMLEDGLMGEVKALQDHAVNELLQGRSVDETRGIWVSIGYKEFKPYYDSLTSEEAGLAVSKAKSIAIEKTKIANRQYAKRQVRWIRIKLASALEEAKASDYLYILDSSDEASFDKHVVTPASDITDLFLKGASRPVPAAVCSPAAIQMLEGNRTAEQDTRTVKHCEICNVTCATAAQWEAHSRSKAHRKLLSRARGDGREISR